jgi:RNA polymerase sigma factor (sigma-70 family)
MAFHLKSMPKENVHRFQSVPPERVSGLMDHLFRHQTGAVIATLIRIFGIENLDLVEDSVQDALVKALQRWPFHGVPENPGGWILRTARNQALDVLRRKKVFQNKEKEIAHLKELEFSSVTETEGSGADPVLADDQLRLIFTCCHPLLTQEAQVGLTLKTLCGFSVSEIARSFLAKESAIAQRLVRAKQKIREEQIPYEVPSGLELEERLHAVLDVLYLFFNEGYNAHEGEDLIRQDLCDEAIRLTALLVSSPVGDKPSVHALLALMLLQSSRLSARVDQEGDLLLLVEQNRSLWNKEMIQLGLHHLSKAAGGDALTKYHLEAGIAACHAVAPSYEATDWKRICLFYEDLLLQNPSPVIALNRAVALSMVHGPDVGIEELRAIENLPAMKSYYLFYAALAELSIRKGAKGPASEYYECALELVATEPERRFLLRKLQQARQ